MRMSIYKAARLNIFEKQREGVITEAQRDELFAILEKEKSDSEMTKSKAMDLLDEMKETFPDLSEDIEKLAKKFDKADDAGDGKEDKKDDGADGAEEAPAEDGGEEEVSEAYKDLLNTIHNL